MVPYYGDFEEDETVRMYFNTFTSDDPAASCTITDLVDADIKVHKDGGTTEIATDGATITINFDSVTGNHMLAIDTSAHADYSTGSDYAARMEGTTVDGATINAWIGCFSIENRTSALLKNATYGLSAIKTLVDDLESRLTAARAGYLDNLNGHTAQTGDSYAIVNGDHGLVSIQDDIDAILVDTNSLNDTKIPDTISLANINAQCDTALSDYGANTTTPPTAAAIADQVWDEAKAGHVGAGSFGEEVQSHALSSEISALNDLSAAEVNAQCDTALSDYDGPTKAEMDTAFTEIKGATWASGTDTLEHIRNKQTDIETDTQDLQTQVGTAGDGLTGVPWNAAWDAEVQSECTDALNAYDPPTRAELTSDISGLDGKLDTIDNFIDTEVAAILEDTGTTIPGLIAALNDISADDVWDATSATLSLSFEAILDRLYQVNFNAMEVNETTGAVTLKTVGGAGTLATSDVDSAAGTTDRDEYSWS